MENNNRDIVKECAAKLREEDNKYPSRLRYNKWFSYWDVDEARLLCKDIVSLMPANLYGEEFIVTSDEKYKCEGKMVVDIHDMILIQYLTPSEFKKMATIYKVFGRLTVVRIEDKDWLELREYCEKMDDWIKKGFWHCRSHKEGDVLNRLWLALGGESIIREDRLGRRVKYLRDLVEKYKVDKDITLLARLGYFK